MQFIIYARKSSESDDRQALSIEAQLKELREYARHEQLDVRSELNESKTAKEPGRPVYNEMLERIERGEADGILSWYPDRLARNSVDGGRIIYLLDRGPLKSLKFPTFWFDNTPQGKFMMNMAFGQSKYYVDNLSENVKRGIREKLRRGEWPGWAPVGYDNDLKNHQIVVDPIKAPMIRKLFREYSTYRFSYDQIYEAAKSWGLTGRRGNKPVTRSEIGRILVNPFYYGHFAYRGELHEGVHKSIISKILFDEVQTVLANRSRMQKTKRHLFPFNRFLKCAECGRALVGQQQKGIHYYRCSSRLSQCSAEYVREDVIAVEVQEAIGRVAVPKKEYRQLSDFVEKNQDKDALEKRARQLAAVISKVDQRLDVLLDTRLDGLIGPEMFVKKKESLLAQKAKLTEQCNKALVGEDGTLEPLRMFIREAHAACGHAAGKDYWGQKAFLEKITFERRLAGKSLNVSYEFPWNFLARSSARENWRGGRDSNPRPPA